MLTERRPGGAGLGSTSGWLGCTYFADEVFVWRAVADGIDMRAPSDALLFARALGAANEWGFDVRGVTLTPLDAGQSYRIDVVMTSRVSTPLAQECWLPPLMFVGPQTAGDLAEAVAKNKDVTARFPKLGLTDYKLLEVTGPAAAIDFWRSHFMLWDRTLGPFGGTGQPTGKFGEQEGVYYGAADAAPGLKPWRRDQPGLQPPGPAGEALGGADLLWISGSVLAVWAGYRFFERRQQGVRT